MPTTETPGLDLGRLLRIHAMVMEAAQVEATYQAGEALAGAYLGLREEMQRLLEDAGLANLRVEFDRLFPTVDTPPSYSPALPESTEAKLAAAATEALIGLAKLHGWIQGLIDEQTLDERMRMDAEEKAKLEGRPPTGFTS
jgi:hypothetical protein